MKFDEQDRVRNHALGFYLALFFGNTTYADISFKTNANRTRAPKNGAYLGKSLYTFALKEKTHEQKLRCNKYKLSFVRREMLFFFFFFLFPFFFFFFF